MNRAERFWHMVDVCGPNECWHWKGHLKHGYGHSQFQGRMRRAHAVAFFLANGRWPEPCCLHSCDNPPCCNPAHLFAGTQTENQADKVAKGRQARGDTAGPTKIPEADLPTIRVRIASGETLRAIASGYGVTKQAIWRIKVGKR